MFLCGPDDTSLIFTYVDAWHLILYFLTLEHIVHKIIDWHVISCKQNKIPNKHIYIYWKSFVYIIRILQETPARLYPLHFPMGYYLIKHATFFLTCIIYRTRLQYMLNYSHHFIFNLHESNCVNVGEFFIENKKHYTFSIVSLKWYFTDLLPLSVHILCI